jgi:CRISPR system Cascade subunit CasE
MYLSCLLINVGDNPDQPRPGRLWLRNRYRVHQRLCMAFPSVSRKSADPAFLQPFKPDDFGTKHVKIRRSTNHGFLFRIDPQPGGRVVILVQSAGKPDWDYAFRNAGYLLAAPPSTRTFDLFPTKEERLQFRLEANPTKRLRQDSRERDGQPVESKWVGKRVPVANDQLDKWLELRAEPAGFRVQQLTSVQGGYVYVSRNGDSGQNRRSVRYDGILKITDPACFEETLSAGIGPGKAFGFGLLSVAPLGQEVQP